MLGDGPSRVRGWSITCQGMVYHVGMVHHMSGDGPSCRDGLSRVRGWSITCQEMVHHMSGWSITSGRSITC